MRTEVLGVGIGDILKFEATALTRVKVKVPDGTRAGDWVNFSLRDNKLVALTDEQDGYALVQPHNCIIDLRYCASLKILLIPCSKVTESAFNILAHRSSMDVIPLCRPALWFRLKKRNARWLLLPLLLH